MSQVIHVSDETYRAIEEIARKQGTTPELLAETLLQERLAEREAIVRQNAEWGAGLDGALARAAHGENTHYADTDALFAALDKIPSKEDDS